MKYLTKLSKLSKYESFDCYNNGVYFKRFSQSLEEVSSRHYCGISENLYDTDSVPFVFLASNVYRYQHRNKISIFTINDYYDDNNHPLSKLKVFMIPISKLKVIDALRRL